MKGTELRIGNWVNTLSGDIQIIDLMTNTNRVGANTKVFTNGITFNIDTLEPIPLTEEWHNKMGVKLDGFGSFRYELPRKLIQQSSVIFSGDYVYLRQGEPNRPDNDIVSIWNKDLMKRDMYVHEWQNLYRALTNTELVCAE